MKSLVQIFTVFICVLSVTSARGGLFNRFTSEMLSNLGFGGGGRWGMNFAQHTNPRGPAPGGADEVLENIMNGIEKDDECEGERCTANEHCCEDSVCVETNGVYGMCMKKYGKIGKSCSADGDCEAGLTCSGALSFNPGTCQSAKSGKLQYNDECHMSNECDATQGLCCQVQRRHRQKPKKVCLYFKDPLMCVGNVENEAAPSHVQYTAGEKRITGNVRAFKHLQ